MSPYSAVGVIQTDIQLQASHDPTFAGVISIDKTSGGAYDLVTRLPTEMSDCYTTGLAYYVRMRYIGKLTNLTVVNSPWSNNIMVRGYNF